MNKPAILIGYKLPACFILAIILISGNIRSFAQQQTSYTLSSGNKQTSIEIKTDHNAQLLYRVLFEGKEELSWSELGLQLRGGSILGRKTEIKASKKSTHKEIIYWKLGENDKISNNYEEITLSCTASGITFKVIARVFDGSIAFRYQIPAQQGGSSPVILKEITQFSFPRSYTIYQYNQETVFSPVAMGEIKSCDFPAVLRSDGLFAVINEADNGGYTKGVLKTHWKKSNSLSVSFIKDSVKVSGDFYTPWRTVSFSKTAIGLYDYSDLIFKLSPSLNQEIPSWIKPGKQIRAQNTTKSGMDCVDFAVKHNYQYVLFDGGWYGKGGVPPLQARPELDLQAVIDYGKKNNIGIMLYTNYDGLYDLNYDFKKLDVILPLYKKWGVAGIKFGFVNGLTQQGLSWITTAIKKVSDHGMMLNIHDNYKPTGLSRTYPALLTQEGIRGNENVPDAFHNVVLPYTRFLSGAADYTFCFPGTEGQSKNISNKIQVSKAQQLALSVVYFSPLQSMLWYGSPGGYTNNQEIEFYDYVPTVWNETRYLKGQIGENVSVARRSGSGWFMGNITGFSDWNEVVKLDFLTKGKTYTATIYEDDEQGGISKRVLTVKQNDNLPINIKAKGGQAIKIDLK